MQPVNHEFEWTHNMASRIKANIMREFNQSEQSSLNDLLFNDCRSKKLEPMVMGMSMGAQSVAMRNILQDSHYSSKNLSINGEIERKSIEEGGGSSRNLVGSDMDA